MVTIEQLKEQIETYGITDWYDMTTGDIYHISAYFHDKKLGLPVVGMPITFANGYKGYIPDDAISKDLECYIKD